MAIEKKEPFLLPKNIMLKGGTRQIQIALNPSGFPEIRKKENMQMSSMENRTSDAFFSVLFSDRERSRFIAHRTENSPVAIVNRPLCVKTFISVITAAMMLRMIYIADLIIFWLFSESSRSFFMFFWFVFSNVK